MTKYFLFTEADRAEFIRIIRKVDGFRGPGVINSSTNMSIGAGRVETPTPNGQPKIFPAALTSDGGNGGSAGVAATFTYTAMSLDGSITYGTSMTPAMQRDTWLVVAAKTGWIAAVPAGQSINGVAPNSDGYVLVSCDEVSNTTSTC